MDKIIKYIERTQIAAGVSFLVIFFFAVLFQIVTRHLSISVIWTEEVANYSFVWAIFMGAAVMVNRRDHFTFDILKNKLTGKKRSILSIINDTILILFNIGIFYFGIQVVGQFWDYNWNALPEMKMGYVWISIPIMAGTMIIYSLGHIVRHVKNFNEGGVQE
ncbi:TRAP-type C4-dicarboxylate transport system, small permease component [Lentibacillus persicus]|uniref:TRAP-type C4-dicarboxylate transport system, small permease component n=1 Tax=Lentibacillus persicus TaxID=640948 RepID=A0A1I1UFE4_9BACI|nr:TRAP transporter small permease [Lentibacillus persicus]SFD69489.1 TRAP-type C4-dicarboxylate transport system, small permease component [Lentibacillus persicus]